MEVEEEGPKEVVAVGVREGYPKEVGGRNLTGHHHLLCIISYHPGSLPRCREFQVDDAVWIRYTLGVFDTT